MWSWKSDGNVLSTQQRLLTGNNEHDMMIHDENWDLTNLKHSSFLKGNNFWTLFFWDEGLHGNYFDLAKRDFSFTHQITGFGRRFCFPPWLMHELQEFHYPEGRTNGNIQSLNCPWTPITTHINKEYRNVLMNQTKLNGLWMDCCFWLFLVTIIACSINLAIRYTHHIPTEYNVS